MTFVVYDICCLQWLGLTKNLILKILRKYNFMTFVALWRLLFLTFVALWCLSHYDVCCLMTFVVYDVCCIMMSVAYWVCRLMTFVALWRLLPFDVFSLWGLMACRLWRLSQCHTLFFTTQYAGILYNTLFFTPQ